MTEVIDANGAGGVPDRTGPVAPGPGPSAGGSLDVPAAVRRLTDGYTLEITPGQVDRLAALRGVLPKGTGIYVTAIPGSPRERLVDAAERIAAEGLRPVPHVAARSFASLDEVDALLAALRERAGVDEVLVIAGSVPRPAGDIDSSIQILRSGVLERHGIVRVGVAGHPEGSPDIGADALAAAVEEKNRFAAESGIETAIVTQFCFDAESYVRYERALRDAGNELPVRAGLPGVTSMATALKYGISCGVGPSMRVLRKQSRSITAFLRPRRYTPKPLVAGIAEAMVADPGNRFGPLHFFPFGGLEDTVNWVAETTRSAAEPSVPSTADAAT